MQELTFKSSITYNQSSKLNAFNYEAVTLSFSPELFVYKSESFVFL